MDKEKKCKSIEILEMFRAFAMTEVFIIHFMNDRMNFGSGWNIPVVSGKFGVAFFFMITSYLLIKTGGTYEGEKKFVKKKLITLIPKYEIILLLIYVASRIKPALFRTFDISGINFFKSFFLIPYKTEGVPFSGPMLPVAWTLIVQLFVYILFAIIMHFLKDEIKTGKILCVLCVMLVVLGQVAGILEHYLQGKKLLTEYGIDRHISMPVTLIWGFLFLLCSCFYKDSVYWAVFVFLGFFIPVLLMKKCKVCRPVLYMGKVSYSFYLIHYLVCKLVTRMIVQEERLGIYFIAMTITYLVTMAAAGIYNYVVDYFVKKITGRERCQNG